MDAVEQAIASLTENVSLTSRFYELRQPRSPWGDYGDALIHGYSHGDWRSNEPFQVERTGPYVPPVTFPGVGCIIVTDEAKHKLMSLGFGGFDFHPIVLARLVRSDWHTWDLLADELPEYPDDGEPEGLLFDSPHDPLLAAELPRLWQWRVSKGIETIRMQTGPRRIDVKLFLDEGSWNGLHIFCGDYPGIVYATPKGRETLCTHFNPWISFARVSRPPKGSSK